MGKKDKENVRLKTPGDNENPFPSGETALPTADKTLSGLSNRMTKIKRRYSRYERPVYALWELFSDYSEISTIHGVRYMGEKKRHWTERLWWLIAVVSSIIVCSLLVYQTWLKWQRTPVIVTFSEQSTPVYEIPFPTVTICTDIKIKPTQMNYTNIWHQLNNESIYNTTNITPEKMKILYSLSPLCEEKPRYFEHFLNLRKTKTLINTTDADIEFFNYAKRSAPSLQDTLIKCNWHRRNINCSKIFTEIQTDEGICFTFNSHNASELYKENRLDQHYHVTRHNRTSLYWNGVFVPNMTEEDIYPYRVLSGSEGLQVELSLHESDIDYMCSGPVQSFKILLHSAGEIPQMKKYYYRIPLDHDIVMAVRPNIVNTTKYLIENYNKDQRKCFAPNAKKTERELLFFKQYTQRNCQLESLTMRTLIRCKCATFGMPRFINTTICRTASELKCVQMIEETLMKRVLNKTNTDYACLPACSSISYDAEMSMAKLDRHNYSKARKSTMELQQRFSRIFIAFKDEQFFSSRRGEVYTLIDFIANCGGILGLFMGVSILSIVEIFYFSTLRIGCSLRKRRQIKKKRMQQLKALNELNDVNGEPNVEENNQSEYDQK